MPRSFRFRPRYRGLAIGAIAIGGVVGVAGALAGALAVGLVTGGIGVALGTLYLLSPAWKIVVHVDDEALEVTSKGDRRFKVTWADVVGVVASPTTKTCFVDGGEPARSLLVPGPGAPAPYDIEDRAGLYDEILTHVSTDRVRQVDLLEKTTR